MGRQVKTLREGEIELHVDVVTKSSTRAGIPNYGVTEITTAQTAGDWVLDAPVEGVRKTIYCVSATTGLVVRGSTGTDVTFTTTGATQINFDGAGTKSISLLGRNSTEWVITAISPVSTALVVSAS